MISKTIIFSTLAFFALIMCIEAACPNKCSGHGTCGVNDKCTCASGWLNGDCSERACPYTRAWIDTAQNSNDAHYYAECGNKGSCNRQTGICKCDKGYTGSGCRRQACPNDCSGHGTCEFIEEMATDTDKRIGGSSSTTYTSWDQQKSMGCKCDPYYEGHDCSNRVCPRGDDPLTGTAGNDEQFIMKQYILIDTASTDFYLTYYDQYGNSWTTAQIDGAADLDADDATVCSNIQTALRRLPNHAMGAVTVAYESGAMYGLARGTNDPVTSGAYTETDIDAANADNAHFRCVVTFVNGPGTTGKQHLLGCNIAPHSTAGMQPIVTGSSSAACSVGEFHSATGSARKLKEIAVCSNRGNCNSETGECQCYSGHKGLACETQEALV